MTNLHINKCCLKIGILLLGFWSNRLHNQSSLLKINYRDFIGKFFNLPLFYLMNYRMDTPKINYLKLMLSIVRQQE